MEVDTTKAEHLFRKASAKGSSNGMYNLGGAIMQNYGEAGAPESIQWLRRSAGLGHQGAVEMLQQVRSPN